MIDSRSATVADLPEIHRIWWAADPFDAFNDNPWFGHVLRTGSMLVATIDVRPIGFAGVRQVGGTTVVSDCFVPGDRPVMTLASSDPKARVGTELLSRLVLPDHQGQGALYTRFGMTVQWDCHYLEGDPGRVERVVGLVLEASGYPVEESDLVHLRDDLRCRFLETGGGHAAVGVDEIESSVVTPAGDPVGVLTAVLGWAADRGDHPVKLHLSDRHPAFPGLIEAGFVVTGADTLMASPGAQVPDPTRVTFNGDILRLPMIW